MDILSELTNCEISHVNCHLTSLFHDKDATLPFRNLYIHFQGNGFASVTQHIDSRNTYKLVASFHFHSLGMRCLRSDFRTAFSGKFDHWVIKASFSQFSVLCNIESDPKRNQYLCNAKGHKFKSHWSPKFASLSSLITALTGHYINCAAILYCIKGSDLRTIDCIN